MRKVIDGMLYDTDKSKEVCDIGRRGFSRNDFEWEDTQLWLTPRGMYFIAGEGGARSRWAERLGQNGCGPGEGLEAITIDEAKQLVEKHSTVEVYIACFGEPEEA